jgi:hypothetical protein
MARTAPLDDFSIEQLLEAVEAKKRARIDDLRAKRAEIAEQLRKIDAEIAQHGGENRVKRGRRGPGAGPSMGTLILKQMAGSGAKEHTIGDLTEALASHTSSDRPNIIVSQALVRLKKDGLVESGGRGLYMLTSGGRKKAAES